MKAALQNILRLPNWLKEMEEIDAAFQISTHGNLLNVNHTAVVPNIRPVVLGLLFLCEQCLVRPTVMLYS